MRRALQQLLRRFALFRVLLRLGVRLFAPKNVVGVVGVVLDEGGRVLIAEHAVRASHRWGLPGGWVGRREDPATALQRELREELGLEVRVERVLLCRTETTDRKFLSPRSIGVAFLCSSRGEPVVRSRELLDVKWVHPEEARESLIPFQREAVRLAVDDCRDGDV